MKAEYNLALALFFFALLAFELIVFTSIIGHPYMVALNIFLGFIGGWFLGKATIKLKNKNMLNPNLHIICGKCGCNHMFEYKVEIETDDDTDEEYFIVYIFCNNCSTLTGLDEIIKEEKKVIIKELTEDEKFMSNHKLGDEYQMDGKPDKWKIAYYPIFEDGKTKELYNEPRALVEKPIPGGTDFREVPLRYLTKI